MQDIISDIDFQSIDTWDKITSFIGFVITVITLIVADNARKVVKRIQSSITSDKRLPDHLKKIDSMLSTYNNLLNNQLDNLNEINSLLGLISSELGSLNSKITDSKVKRSIKQTQAQIRSIRQLSYYPTDSQNIFIRAKQYLFGNEPSISNVLQMNYIQIGEIYTSVNNLYKDSKTKVVK